MTAIPKTDHLSEARSAVSAAPDSGGASPVQKAMRAVGLATTAWHLAKQAQDHHRQWKSRREYTVTVSQGDDLYWHVQDWVLGLLPPTEQRSLEAETRRRLVKPSAADGLAELVASSRDRVEEWTVSLHYDGSREQTVTVGGHPVAILVDDPGRDDATGGRHRPKRVVFRTKTEQARDAVTAALQALADRLGAVDRQPRLITTSRWGEWQVAGHRPPRALSTVHLPEDQTSEVLADLRQFMGAEATYLELGLPYHRGYLFHGVPGTGKTSLAQALATELRLDLYHLPLGDLAKDVVLNDLARGIAPGSALLLEDVDVATGASLDRDAGTGGPDGAEGPAAEDQDGQGVTLAGLLNMLDGVTTPHGMVVFMTTNRHDALDPALIRPGRCDMSLELGYIEAGQASELLERLTGWELEPGESWDDVLGAPFPGGVTPAELVDIVKLHLYDRDRAWKECVRFLADRAAAWLEPF